MQFVADESVDAPVYKALRDAGYNIFAIVEHHPGITDEEVLQIAYDKSAVLITQDKDFGELTFRMGKPHHGIIRLRLSGLPPLQKAGIVISVFEEHKQELPSSFTVILSDFVKIRKG
jgi:predicted nuclease of predicted toxin-antitoxin system